MSLYPPSQAYSHIGYSYATQTYPQPPPQQPAYHPPFPPQALFYADQNHFRRDYTSRLAQLTFNSRPHIQSLSMIAQDYTRYADIVVQCVEQHIRRVPPWMKLPAFYLLDAMSKNVFDPYARLFAPIVVRLFLDTYESVDQATRLKMEEMLSTWKNGAPNGRELFGIVAQNGIERDIWGGESTQANLRPDPMSISTAQVLSELEFILGHKEHALQANPYDKQSQSHVQILQQLRKLVQAGVQQGELGQILTQLRALSPAPPPVAPAPPVVPVSQPYPPAATSYHAYPPAPQHIAPPAPVYAVPPAFPSSHAPPMKPEPVDIPVAPSAQPAPVMSTSSATPMLPVNVSSLFNKILQTGVLSASSTPVGAGATAKAETSFIAETVQDSPSDYAESILSAASRLTSVDIIKHRPSVATFLYDRLPSQCKQCGVRFGGDIAGKKRLEDHLDMHFRQNRHATQANARGYSRGWFVGIDDWLNDGVADVKGKRRAGAPRSSTKAVAAEEAAQRDAELRSMTVVVPPGEEANSVACPICKEHLKLEFNEDDEEWVWRNAVRKDDRIYHATCHAEAMVSKSTLATRLRTETSSRSRSLTPESIRSPPRSMNTLPDGYVKTGSPSPSKMVGTKRKVAVEDYAHSRESTPPNKKLALSA